MSQHDLTIANQGFPAFRADLNSALQALGSTQSGTAAPSPTFANQLWYDTANNILKIRNEDNDAWISIATLDQSGDVLSVIALNTISEGTSGAGVTVDGVLLKDNAVTASADSTISGLRVGKGLANIATNTALGASALAATTTGNFNTALGYRAGLTDTTGYYNTLVGADVGNTLTTGFQNTAVGSNNFGAGSGSATTGNSNSAFGYASMYSLTSGSSNTAYGQSSLYANTTGGSNTAIGLQALSSNTTAPNNTAVGYQSLYSNTTGDTNVAVGYRANYSNTTGTNNVGVGKDAIYSVTTGVNNTAIGDGAGRGCTGNVSTFVGASAGIVATGSSNTFIGCSAGEAVTSGANNTILGRYNGNQGGVDIREASNFIVLSDGGGNPRFWGDGSGRFVIGDDNNGGAKLKIRDTATPLLIFNGGGTSGFFNQIVFRNSEDTAIVGSIVRVNNNAVAYNTTSDYRLKENIAPITGALAKVQALKPVTYTWKTAPDEIGEGFIAHELAEVCPRAVTGEKDAVNEDGSISPQSIDTSFLVATLTAAIQELKAEFDAYKAKHP
jgi:hypothetical protein